ncbi:hypothetical protein SFR_5009 [Streptomyces sp. FR-008]|nr:hypothetical protein SFR_5009 [Streptomyces sp. FR-008]
MIHRPRQAPRGPARVGGARDTGPAHRWAGDGAGGPRGLPPHLAGSGRG